MEIRHFIIIPILIVTLALISGCSKSDETQACGSSSIVITENDICLVFEHNGLSTDLKNNIEGKVFTAITEINDLMPVSGLEIRIVENSNLTIPEIGMGGYNPNQQEVIIAINADFNDLESSLEENFIAQLAHEIHHAKRRRSVGYGNTLFQAAVTEGLADHFSIEVTGIAPPPWSVALTGTELQDWISTASNTWNEPSYNHNAWFFGTGSNIPRWTGYAIGYELVKNYLLENPGERPSNLHDEPASSFQP